MCRLPLVCLAALLVGGPGASAAVPTTKAAAWRAHAAAQLAPRPAAPGAVADRPAATAERPGYPWKRRIMTTVFWIGESAARHNPVPNDKSSWDSRWARNYGGYDNPDPGSRRGFLPAAFTPRLNPFYIALPYNDITRRGTKPEAARVIPWFKDTFVRSGRSVCKGRWIAIHYRGRIAYAQWEDAGPFRTDHWEYVFGDERPAPNRNGGAGLDVSPAVRDYLGMKTNDHVDWRFVEFEEVPLGPWALRGDNNGFLQRQRRTLADAKPPATLRTN